MGEELRESTCLRVALVGWLEAHWLGRAVFQGIQLDWMESFGRT